MTDTAEHLRAAALSTLKSKRRKPITEKPFAPVLSRPLPPTESFQLDYGFEEDISKSTSSAPKNQSRSVSFENKPSKLLFDEGHSREEGEISDEEEPPKVQSPPSVEQLSTPPQLAGKSKTPEHKNAATEETPFPTTHLTASSDIVMTETQPSASTSSLMDRLSEQNFPLPSMKQEEEDDSNLLMNVSQVLDSEHVRPGLTLNQEEYDTVKDIVLDLLGWDVEVDYLLESGISRSLLYYVFNELNLRLPDNFDTSNIVPYTPEALAQIQQETSASFVAPANSRPISPKLSLSSRLTTPPSVSYSAPLAGSPVDSDLHDMERRRRQELVARKAAVQASRKSKQSAKSSIAVQPAVLDSNEQNSIVPTDTVDDFLNSLGPVQDLQLPINEASHSTQINQQLEVKMEVDSVIEQKQVTEPEKRATERVPSDPSFFEPPPSSSEPPPDSASSTATSYSSVQSSETLGSNIQLPPTGNALRRGTKRPVASDFVDFEAYSPANDVTNRHVMHTNGSDQNIIQTRRLPAGASFHNVGASRRCVIDLSDSEDEGSQSTASNPAPNSEDGVRQLSQTSRQGRQNTYSSSYSYKGSDDTSPAALAQKESEIRKMRELIAQREEETRLRKLAMAKSNAGTRPSSTKPTLVVPPKQEAQDVIMAVADRLANNDRIAMSSRDPESATPPLKGGSDISSMDATNITFQVQSSGDVEDIDMSSVHPELHMPADTASQTQDPQVSIPTEPTPNKASSLAQQSACVEGSVDADQSPSPSTQMTSPTKTSLDHPRQDAKKSDLLEVASSNNELEPQDNLSGFSVYRSPFDSYPCLQDHLGPQRTLSGQISTSRDIPSVSLSNVYQPTRPNPPSNFHVAHTKPPTLSYLLTPSILDFPLPDLQSFKLASALRMIDPSKRLCQYEIPGGGTCRDDNCEDVHLSRLEDANLAGMVHPSDEELAHYLFSTLPHSWLAQHQITSPTPIMMALKKIGSMTLNAPLSYERKVRQALLAVGRPPGL